MPQIRVENLDGLQINVPEGTTTHVLDLVHERYVDWMHACGKKGRCTTCKMEVVHGMEGLSEPTKFEEKMKARKKLTPTQRLACQTRVESGEVVVRVPPETQLPHQHYT